MESWRLKSKRCLIRLSKKKRKKYISIHIVATFERELRILRT